MLARLELMAKTKYWLKERYKPQGCKNLNVLVFLLFFSFVFFFIRRQRKTIHFNRSSKLKEQSLLVRNIFSLNIHTYLYIFDVVWYCRWTIHKTTHLLCSSLDRSTVGCHCCTEKQNAGIKSRICFIEVPLGPSVCVSVCVAFLLLICDSTKHQ